MPVRDAAMAPQSTVLDETYKIALTRLGDRLRVGGMAELAGFDLRLNPRRRATLEKVTRELFPCGDLSQAQFWTGLRPMTPDGAQLLADVVSGRQPAIRTEGLDMSRYGARRATSRPGRLAVA